MSTKSAFNRPHLLIISDDTGLSSFLGEGLMIAGFWTSTVASALQAIEVFRLRTFDLIIVDAALDGLGSGEFLRRLRAVQRATGNPLSNRPALVIAASTEEMTDVEALEAGANQIVFAPFDIDEIAMLLFASVEAWRDEHPGEPWADELAQQK